MLQCMKRSGIQSTYKWQFNLSILQVWNAYLWKGWSYETLCSVCVSFCTSCILVKLTALLVNNLFKVDWFFNLFVLNVFPILIKWTNPLAILGVLGGIFHFYSNFNGTFGKQTVETLIRRCILQRLIWVCTVCLCPINRMLGLFGLKFVVLL